MDVKRLTRDEMVDLARFLARRGGRGPTVRFRHQGRNPAGGLDCAGVPLWIAHRVGLTEFDFTAYERYPDGHTLLDVFKQQMVEKPWDEAEVGDVLLLRAVDRGWPCHMAVLVDNRDGFRGFGIVHSWAKVRGVVETILDEDWALNKAVGRGVWGWPQLENGG